MADKNNESPLFKQVWVCIEGSSSRWRETMRGAIDRLRSASGVQWAAAIDPRKLPNCATLRKRGVAVVTRMGLPGLSARLDRGHIPGVNVSGFRLSPFPRADADDAIVGRLASAAFRRMGLPQLVYAGDASEYSAVRGRAFAEESRRQGCEVTILPAKTVPGKIELEVLIARAGGRPVGIFACNDEWAVAILTRCLSQGLRVPRRVCILGVGNEDTVLMRSPLPLSTIEIPSYAIGASAVDILLEWRKRPESRPGDRLLPPLRVIHRHTTDATGIRDPIVKSALSLIDAAPGETLSVNDVVRRIGKAARRTLEERFRRETGRGIYVGILDSRIAKAKELLASPSLSIKQVAYLGGFSSPQKFSAVFRRIEGTTPIAFRRRLGVCGAT